MGLQEIVDVKEVAEFLKLSEETVYHLAKSGQIPAIKIGNQWRFDLNEIKRIFKNKFPNSNDEGDSEDEADNE